MQAQEKAGEPLHPRTPGPSRPRNRESGEGMLLAALQGCRDELQ